MVYVLVDGVVVLEFGVPLPLEPPPKPPNEGLTSILVASVDVDDDVAISTVLPV